MPKGIFTQGVAVLFRREVDVSEMRARLEPEFSIAKEVDTVSGWELGGPTLVIGYRPELNGYVSVDTVGRCWPDDMGDPKKSPTLFGAWMMGHFGPFAFPNGLHRSIQQARGWDGTCTVIDEHRAFVRIRLSYAFGAPKNAPTIPEGVRPVDELDFVMRIAERLLQHPDALCVFVPSGELVLDARMLADRVAFAREHRLSALDVWTNIRMFTEEGWLLMDTVGNGQLDLPDLEAAFPAGTFNANDVYRFLRDATLYLLQKGQVVKDGDTMAGPARVDWRAQSYEKAIAFPPRPVLRFLPTNVRKIPERFRPPGARPGFFKRWFN